MKKLVTQNKGFTLIELLVVVAIIGVLTVVTIAILNPSAFFGRGRNTQRKTDLQSVRGALEQYYLDNGRQYPNIDSYGDDLKNALSPYLSEWPTDPSGGSYTYTVEKPDLKCYELSATLENNEGTYTTCGGSLSCQVTAGYCGAGVGP